MDSNLSDIEAIVSSRPVVTVAPDVDGGRSGEAFLLRTCEHVSVCVSVCIRDCVTGCIRTCESICTRGTFRPGSNRSSSCSSAGSTDVIVTLLAMACLSAVGLPAMRTTLSRGHRDNKRRLSRSASRLLDRSNDCNCDGRHPDSTQDESLDESSFVL